MQMQLKQYFPIAQAMAALLHPFGEVVIHDVKRGRIAAIFNNLSKRKAGDDSLLEEMGNPAEYPDVFPLYFKTNWDGRKMKSATATLRDAKGTPIGLFCVNIDLSKWEEMGEFVQKWMGEVDQQPKALFKDDWKEKINHFVSSYLKQKAIALNSLTKENKRALVLALHREGAFKAKNAAHYIADVLGISRATIYNYLRM